MTLGNIILKINSKVGGINQIIATKENPLYSIKTKDLKPVMYIGADVTHPSPDQIGKKPSIAAMVSLRELHY